MPVLKVLPAIRAIVELADIELDLYLTSSTTGTAQLKRDAISGIGKSGGDPRGKCRRGGRNPTLAPGGDRLVTGLQLVGDRGGSKIVPSAL